MKISFLLMFSCSQAVKAVVWCRLLLEENITRMMSQWHHQHLRLSLETKNVQQKSLPNCICGVWKMFMLQAGRVWWKKQLSCILGNVGCRKCFQRFYNIRDSNSMKSVDNLKSLNLYSLLVLELKVNHQNTISDAPFTFIKLSRIPHTLTYSGSKWIITVM